MPLYEYHCKRCDAVATELRTMASRKEYQLCRCGGRMKLAISPVAGKVINPAHQKKERARHYRDRV